jgi:hypothetical protein
MSQTSTRAVRIAYVVMALVFLVVVGGYQAGKHMAQRDAAQATAAS